MINYLKYLNKHPAKLVYCIIVLLFYVGTNLTSYIQIESTFYFWIVFIITTISALAALYQPYKEYKH